MTNDDDSWEVAAQAALDIHRRTTSAVRERVTTGTGRRRKVRPRTRPVSAPTGRLGHRPPSANGRNLPATVLVPSLSNAPTVNGISQAELEAWATLSHGTRRSREPKATVSFYRARPRSAFDRPSSWGTVGAPQGTTTSVVANDPRKRDAIPFNMEQLGPGLDFGAAASATTTSDQQVEGTPWASPQYQGAAKTSKTPSTSAGRFTTEFRRTVDESCLGAHSRCYRDSLGRLAGGSGALARGQNVDDCRKGRAEHEAVLQRQRERDRSDVSVRFLREHARKAMKEEKAFLKTLRAEAKAKEDSQIEMVNRATQWARDLDRDVLYLPHRVDGKLNVLKIENCFAGARLGEALEEKGTIISVDCFLKRDHARLEKEYYTAPVGADGNRNTTAVRTKELSKSKGSTSRKYVRDRPNAADTCRELHQLIRETVGLVEVLTRQAMELEGQGWNLPQGGSRSSRQRRTRT